MNLCYRIKFKLQCAGGAQLSKRFTPEQPFLLRGFYMLWYAQGLVCALDVCPTSSL